MPKETIFVDGFYSNDVSDTAPEFILGRGSLHINKLKKFLEENEKYAVKGYLDYTILRSKDAGSRYVALDLYRFNKSNEEQNQAVVENNSAQTSQDISVEDIPF